MLKSIALGIAGAQLALRAPSSIWEASGRPFASSLLLDGAWIVLLSGSPALLGWPRAVAWRGAATTAVVALGASLLWLGVAFDGSLAGRTELLLRVARLGAESTSAIVVLSITGAWLVVAPRN